jgi:signal transduction histidine kinase
VMEIARHRARWFESYARMALLDLAVASIVYFLDYSPGGPLFVLFYLGLISAGLTMSMRNTIVYTAVVLAVVALITPSLPGWRASNEDLRQISARLITFSLVGIGTALLMRRLQQEIAQSQQMREEAIRMEELTRLRTEFVDSVSHDLQTPLTAVRAGLGMLTLGAHTQLSDDEQRILENARRNVERLGRLIDDLLAYNQLETGTLRLDASTIDLRMVVQRAADAVELLMREKQQDLTVTLNRPLPIHGDSHRLDQVFVNLLVNAHRHTPRGTHIAVTDNSADDDVIICVHDTGPGVPADEVDQIFERYHRLTTVGSSSGLGLAIARGIVRLHGGRIWASSSPGAGMTICVALPGAREAGPGDDGEAADR